MDGQEDNGLLRGSHASVFVPIFSQSRANFCGWAKVVLFCLGVHAWALCRIAFFEFVPRWFDGVLAPFCVLSTVIGVGACVNAICHRGLANRVVGIVGFFWLTFIILFSVVWA